MLKPTLCALSILILHMPATLAQTTNSLIWKISGDKVTTPSYLFGTIHMLPEEEYFFTEEMSKALESSERLVLEADMDIPLKEQLAMAQEMLMPDGRTWQDYLSEEEFATVRRAFVDSMGIKAKKFEKRFVRIRPIYVSGLVMTEALGKVKMYEQELMGMVKKDKKPVIGLETIQEQMKIVSSIPIEDQMDDLKETAATMMQDYEALLDAYTSQDLDLMNKLSRENESFEKMEHQLLTERNDRWVVKIQELLSDTSSFIAVGAMHLVGEKGLIEQLRAAGYTVEPIIGQ